MKRNILICLILISLFTNGMRVFATNNVDTLESTTSDLEAELSSMENQIQSVESELNDIITQMQVTSSSLEHTREDLAIAKGKQEAQYESMKLRIKYMYENGNTSFLEMLFSSASLAEFLNRSEYYASIMKFDREILEEFQALQDEISAKEQVLLDTQSYLSSLQETLDEKEKNLREKYFATSTELSVYEAKLNAAREEAKRLEEVSKEEIIPVVPEPVPEPDHSFDPEPELEQSETLPSDETIKEEEKENEKESILDTASDLELLAGLLECEAGTSDYEGLLAVGSVVVNRMNSNHYPDTLRGVIFQSGQFPPAINGNLDKILERGVKELCLTAAQDALNGKNNIGDCLQFRSASSGHVGTIIGSNVFY